MALSPVLVYCGLESPPLDELGREGTYYRSILTQEVWGPKTREGWPKKSLGVRPVLNEDDKETSK